MRYCCDVSAGELQAQVRLLVGNIKLVALGFGCYSRLWAMGFRGMKKGKETYFFGV